MYENLHLVDSKINFEIYGLDVFDHGLQDTGFIDKTIEKLSSQIPKVDWNSKISLISANDLYPYEDNYFDVIISNQVLEHINRPDNFLDEIYRLLKHDGFSIHIFPLAHCLWEPHLGLPLVHKIYNHEFLLAFIKYLSFLGLGKFKIYQKFGTSLQEFSEKHADYILYYTNYLTSDEIYKLGKKSKLRTSFKYTYELYCIKIKSVLKLTTTSEYKLQRSLTLDCLSINFLKCLSSITLFLEKTDTYKKQ